MIGEASQHWAIVGLGNQAGAIARRLHAVAGVELSACASSSPERAIEFAGDHRCRAYRSSEELLGSRFDLIIVAGVNSEHADHCIAALEAGSPVLCEKPLALTVADAARILEVSRSTGHPVFVGYHYRFRSLSLEIRELVRNGEIGEVRDVYMQRTSELATAQVRPWRHDLARAGAGVLCDVGVHLVDYITWLTDRTVLSVGAVASPARSSGRPDEHVVVDLELDNGALAVIDAARSLPNAGNALQIHGSKGSISTGPLRWVDRYQAELHRGKGSPRIIECVANDPLLEELIAVRDAGAGRAGDRLASGEEGRAGVAVLEATIRSLDSGRRVLASLS